MLETALAILIKSIVFTISQLFTILAIFFIIGWLLYILEKATTKNFIKSLGKKSLYFTALIGTPLHELGHFLFCIIFNHRVKEVRLFKLDHSSGQLGYVTHSYNQKSLYQSIGNLFIGAAPLITGTILIFFLYKFLLPEGQSFLNQYQSFFNYTEISLNQLGNIFLQSTILFFSFIFRAENISNWQFWLFLYLTLSISAHIAPSPADFKGITNGLLTISVLLFLINFVTFIFNFNLNTIILSLGQYQGILIGFFILAIILSFLYWFISLAFYLISKLLQKV